MNSHAQWHNLLPQALSEIELKNQFSYIKELYLKAKGFEEFSVKTPKNQEPCNDPFNPQITWITYNHLPVLKPIHANNLRRRLATMDGKQQGWYLEREGDC